MTCSLAKALCILILLPAAIRGVRCPAQSTGGRLLPFQLPRLCMPVSFRQTPYTPPVNTKIPMMGDRYREVNEAISGWNEVGVPLVGRVDGRWEPVPCGDDTGIFYLVPLLARTTGWGTDRSLDSFNFGVLAISAITGMAGLWLTASGLLQRLIALVPICVGEYLSYKVGDVYVIQGSVVLMLIPWLVYSLKAGVIPRRRFLIVFLSGVILGFAQWIRTPASPPVLVFFLILLCSSLLQRFQKILLALTLVAGMCLPLQYAQIPLHQRDRFLAEHQPGYRPPLNHHLFWHTAYLGLSYLTNPFVREWRDGLAVEYVQAIDPAAIYGGEEYDTLLRSQVADIAHRHPKFILDTIAAKCGVLVCMLLLSINIGFAAAISKPKPPSIEMALWLAMAIAAAPGVIAIPIASYVLGMITLALYYWYYSLSFYVGGRFVIANRRLQTEALLSTYPRSRPELPRGQRASYIEHYRSNRDAKRGLARFGRMLESWMHRRVAEGITGGILLEIGAGNLNHLPYLPVACVCDAVEPFQELWLDSPYRSRIRNIYSDLEQIPQTRRYDCIFSVAVLEHLTDFPSILARAGLLLREGGTFRAGFPTEGGLLWGLAWRLTTGIEYRLKRGLDYGAIMRHEHLNSSKEILLLLNHFYEQVEISRFPLPLEHLSFYTTAIARRPRVDRCMAFEAIRSERGTAVHE
jgi:hypothetical protein